MDLIWSDTHSTVKCTSKAAVHYDVTCKLLYKCTAAISNKVQFLVHYTKSSVWLARTFVETCLGVKQQWLKNTQMAQVWIETPVFKAYTKSEHHLPSALTVQNCCTWNFLPWPNCLLEGLLPSYWWSRRGWAPVPPQLPKRCLGRTMKAAKQRPSCASMQNTSWTFPNIAFNCKGQGHNFRPQFLQLYLEKLLHLCRHECCLGTAPNASKMAMQHNLLKRTQVRSKIFTLQGLGD